MARTEIMQRFEIDAGHRLQNHKGKCKNPHGHRYVFLLTLSAEELTPGGMVVDFADVKREVGLWLDERWDHGMLLQRGDPLVTFFATEAVQEDGLGAQEMKQVISSMVSASSGIREPKVAILELPPTAESLARLSYEKCIELLRRYPTVRVVTMQVFETPNCSATYPARGGL